MRHSFQFFRNWAQNSSIPPMVVGAMVVAPVTAAIVTFVSAQKHSYHSYKEKLARIEKICHESEKEHLDSVNQFNAQKEAFKSRLDEFKAL